MNGSQPRPPAPAGAAGAAPRGPLLVAAVACVLYLASELYLLSGTLGFPLDDSWIHLTFARRLAAGQGLAFNAGRWVPGSTAPLWTALLALGFTFPGAVVPWAKLLGGVFFLTTVDATGRLAAELGCGSGLRRLAAVLVAASHWLVWSALSGMEILLFATLSLWGMILHLRERGTQSRLGAGGGSRGDPRSLPVSLPVLALAALARPEGYLLLLLAVGDRLVRWVRTPDGRRIVPATSWRRLRDDVLLAALVLLPTLVVYRVLGGSLLPTTFAVKAGPMGDLVPSGRYLRAVVDVFFRSQPILLLLAGAGCLRLVARLGSGRDRGLLPALWPLALALSYSLLAPDQGPVVVGNFGRYYFPLLPVVVVLGVLGLGAVRWPRTVTVGRLGLPLRPLLLILLLAPQLWGLATGSLLYARTVANVEDSDVAAARWLAERLPPEAVLAVQDIGAIKYRLPNPVVDLTGIVNPEILPVLRGTGGADPAAWEERLRRYLETVRPACLVVFPTSYPQLTRSPGFLRLRTFPVHDNVAMAGHELAVFSTPWTLPDERLEP